MSLAAGTALPPTPAMRDDPIRATQHLFRLTMDALANPGSVRHAIHHPLFVDGETPFNPFLASLAMTLLDHEVSLATLGIDADALQIAHDSPWNAMALMMSPASWSATLMWSPHSGFSPSA